jgi:CRISPR/Cas system-associated exonuclease Cas4 (RecB family)
MNAKNEEYINYVFDWMDEVYNAYKENTPPKRGYTKSTWTCKSCPVAEACLEREEGVKKIENLKVGLE